MCLVLRHFLPHQIQCYVSEQDPTNFLLENQMKLCAGARSTKVLHTQRRADAGSCLPVEELPENSAVGVASAPHPDVFLQAQILHLMLHSENRKHTHTRLCFVFIHSDTNTCKLVDVECLPKKRGKTFLNF